MQAKQVNLEKQPKRVDAHANGNALLRREEFATNLRKQKRKEIINIKRAEFAGKNWRPFLSEKNN